MKKPFIVAEAAQGFEGDLKLACLLVRAAAAAKADAVKFQLVYADEIATPDYKYYGLFENLEMSPRAWRQVAKEAKRLGIELYFDVFGVRSFRQALSLKAQGLKIHATDFYHDNLLYGVFQSGLKVLVSCAGLGEADLLDLFERHPGARVPHVTFLHGFQAEPTPLAANNLRRLLSLSEVCLPAGIGFMDHSDGAKEDALELSLLALPLGISVLEKHITLDRELGLEDFVSALPPSGFKAFVTKIRKYGKAMGSLEIQPGKMEAEYRLRSAKVLVAARNLKKGAILKMKDIKLLRVANQDSMPTLMDPRMALGVKIKNGIRKHSPILAQMLASN